MAKIKEPAVANIFYSANPDELRSQIKGFAKNNPDSYEYPSRAVIVPHAGLVYSGRLAYEGINLLDKNIKNLFIFAPAHRVAFEGLALTSYDEWKTPLGNISINQEINKELTEKFGAKIFESAYREEHSIEIQLPIVQSIFEYVKIIPVLIGKENPQKITDIISEYYDNKDFGFIISSDLSHFLTDDKAKKKDEETARMIEGGSVQDFRYDQACGAIGIYGLVEFANSKNYSLIRVDMFNSSSTTGDKSRVVGYGSWFMYEGSKNKFLKKYFSEYMLKLCRDVISSRFNQQSYSFNENAKNENPLSSFVGKLKDNFISKPKIYTNHAPVFNEIGACFVTLKKNGRLRGCIGSIIAHQPLINDLVDNAQKSAFNDPRFNPLQKSELDDLSIDISILSEPKPITFSDEADLLRQIVPFKDGIIIRDGYYQAVYLPSVWEELPDKEMFLKSLKMKAGLSPEYFSKTFKAFRFQTEYIQ